MKCLLFTVFTLVLICALFKGTESAGRRETPSIRYNVNVQTEWGSEKIEKTLSPPWGNWFLDVTNVPPTFVSERPIIDIQWTPIAQLKMIKGAMHVIQMASQRRSTVIPSNGSGLLMVPQTIWEWFISVSRYDDPIEVDGYIRLIALEQYTISIDGATPMPMDYRSSIPVYTTFVLHKFNDMWIYQPEAGRLIDVSRVFGLDYSYTEKYTAEIGDIKVRYPKSCRHLDDVDRVEIFHPTNNELHVLISKYDKHILEGSGGGKVLFGDIQDGDKVFLDDIQDSAR